MYTPELPGNEHARLAALHQLLLLDTPPEARFNTIVDYAAAEFDVPICLVTLLDGERQWFKARVGMPEPVCATHRDISFCTHAILHDDIMVVPDAALDERFFDNPLVTDEPHIRFYAGAPLILPSGYAMGTLCIIDTKPRQLDAEGKATLARMRDWVVRELI